MSRRAPKALPPPRHGEAEAPRRVRRLLRLLRLLLATVACALDPVRAAEASLPLRTNDVVALIGGAALVAEQRSGEWETALQLTHPQHRLRVKNFAWEGDTVASQPREVNYPSLRQLLAAHQITVAFLQFGQTEALAGLQGLPAFRRDYEALLESLGQITPRLVLVTPTRWDPARTPFPAPPERNAMLARYVEVIREIGAARQLPVIDVFSPELTASGSLTTDGRQLTAEGRAAVAIQISAAGPGASTRFPGFDSAPVRALQAAVVAKNQLWFHYVRPTNWAFLGGDRTEQLSSRDHRDKNIRWFPQEMERFVPLLENANRQIDLLTAQTAPGTPTTR